MAAVKPGCAKTKTLDEECEVGLRSELLNHALHGGGCSTSPPIYSVHSGLSCIVSTALSGMELLLIIYTMITMIIYYANSKHNVQ